jgi:amidophosphoribosyltransferase
MRRLVAQLRKLGPTAIHLAIFSPPVRHPCFYGVDMPTHAELLAAQMGDEGDLSAKLAAYFDTDSVTYLSIEGLHRVSGEAICDACFTGRYVVPVSEAERDAISAERRARG